MEIKFIRDDFLEGKKQELDDINKVLSEKPKKIDRNILFLKRFTLALMGQYKVKKYLHEKHEEIERINKIITEHTNKLYKTDEKIPQPPQYQKIPTPNVPAPNIQRKNIPIKAPAPLREELKIPEPIKINNYNKDGSTKIEKKEFSVPNPL